MDEELLAGTEEHEGVEGPAAEGSAGVEQLADAEEHADVRWEWGNAEGSPFEDGKVASEWDSADDSADGESGGYLNSILSWYVMVS